MYATLAGGRLTESALAPLVSRHYFIRWPGRAYGFTACGVSLVLTAVRRVDRLLGAERRSVDGWLSACGPVQCTPCALGLNICAVPDLRRSALVPHSSTVVFLQRRAACAGSSAQWGVVAGRCVVKRCRLPQRRCRPACGSSRLGSASCACCASRMFCVLLEYLGQPWKRGSVSDLGSMCVGVGLSRIYGITLAVSVGLLSRATALVF